MEVSVKLVESETVKIGDTYRKQKKDNGKKGNQVLLIHIEGDYGYIVDEDKSIKKVLLTLLEAV